MNFPVNVGSIEFYEDAFLGVVADVETSDESLSRIVNRLAETNGNPAQDILDALVSLQAYANQRMLMFNISNSNSFFTPGVPRILPDWWNVYMHELRGDCHANVETDSLSRSICLAIVSFEFRDWLRILEKQEITEIPERLQERFA